MRTVPDVCKAVKWNSPFYGIEGQDLRTVGPKKTRGFFDINGYVAGRCVEGRGKAIWNGQQYVNRVGRVKDRPC